MGHSGILNGKKKTKVTPSFWTGTMLQLQTICYIEPVLAFGTEQNIIVNSCCPRSRHSQRLVSQSFNELHKNATCKSDIVLVSLRVNYPGNPNQVLATGQVLYLLVYIDEI
jgi:hypothetical protein